MKRLRLIRGSEFLFLVLLTGSVSQILSCSRVTEAEDRTPAVLSTNEISSHVNSGYSFFGLSTSVKGDELRRYQNKLVREGYKVTSFTDRKLRAHIDGLDAQGLGHSGFTVIDPEKNSTILTAFFEEDGTIGLINCDIVRYPLKQDDSIVLKPGTKWNDVKAKFPSASEQDSGMALIFEAPDGWVSCSFFKDTLRGFTLSSKARGPVAPLPGDSD